MSASNENSAIFMTDDPKKIAKKIKSHAFSGGRATQKEHQRLGGDPDVDIAYPRPQVDHSQEYRAGTLSTSQMKEACIEMLQKVVEAFQKVSGIFAG